MCTKTKIRYYYISLSAVLLDYNLHIPLYYCNVGICIRSCTHSWFNFMRPIYSIGPKMDELFPLPGMKS